MDEGVLLCPSITRVPGPPVSSAWLSTLGNQVLPGSQGGTALHLLSIWMMREGALAR